MEIKKTAGFDPKMIKRRRYNLSAATADDSTSGHTSRRPTYAQWIAKAIVSSPGRAMTLADINDWMIKNVPGLEEQRYLHSCKGWKNAVRHTLSINRHRFRKMPQSGKPSFWCMADPDSCSPPNKTDAPVQPQMSPVGSSSSTSWSPTSDQETVSSHVTANGRGSATNIAGSVINGFQSVANGSVSVTGSAFHGSAPVINGFESVTRGLGSFGGIDGDINGRGSLSGSGTIIESILCGAMGGGGAATNGTLLAQNMSTVQQLDVMCQDGSIKKLYLPSPLPLTDINLRILCSPFVPDVSTQTLLWAHLNRKFINDSLAAASLSTPNIYNLCDTLKNESANYFIV